jgi:alpha-ribazole phosphatase
MAEAAVVLHCWRHPRATGASGRCIGQTDLRVDPRKAKRLAHRIRAHARRQQLGRTVWVSPLQRACAVGQCLRRWAWRVHVDARLMEMNFGQWDGQAWSQIAWADVQAWEADLLHHAPGGGESLWTLSQRVRQFVDAAPSQALQLVTHGGWINALLHVPPGCTQLAAAQWPAAPRHSSLTLVCIA